MAFGEAGFMSASKKIVKIVKDVRVIIMLVALVLGLFMLHPDPFASGLVIKSVTRNSSAYQGGIRP